MLSIFKNKFFSRCYKIFICHRFKSEELLCVYKNPFYKLLYLDTITNSKYYSDVSSLDIFDRNAKRFHRNWSASVQEGHVFDYVKDEIGDRVADRVFDITRNLMFILSQIAVCFPFELFALGLVKEKENKMQSKLTDVYSHCDVLTNEFQSQLMRDQMFLFRENVEMIYQCDSSPKMLEKSKISEDIPTFRMVVDEEYLPFAENSVDIFISSLNFHWINDLPSVFEQIHHALKPDGVLIASMFGGDTLFELRSSLQLAETEREGGFSPHISPFARIRDIGDLLTRAGYTMLTIVGFL
ncbi:UNVERIFIED_CONTAM: Ndufaf5 [Trichonephila clavipes]